MLQVGPHVGPLVGPRVGVGNDWSNYTQTLHARFTEPSAQTLPTSIAEALALTGRTFDDFWRFNVASGNVTGAAGNVLSVVGAPRFSRTAALWDGSSMTAHRAVEFTGTSTAIYFTAANASLWQLDESITWVLCLRMLRPASGDRGLLGTRTGSGNAGYTAVLSSDGRPKLRVHNGTTQSEATPATLATAELDGIMNGSVQWLAFKMDLTAGTSQILAMRQAGTAVAMPAGAKVGAQAVQIGGQSFMFDPDLCQVLWAGVLSGAEAEAFDLTALNALDNVCRPIAQTYSPSGALIEQEAEILTGYLRHNVTCPEVADESGFGLRMQACHGSSVSTALVHFPHLYHPSATVSEQKLAALFNRGGNGGADANKRNLLLRTDDVANAAWTKSNITTTANNGEDPFGFTGAARVALTAAGSVGTLRQTYTAPDATQHCHSFYGRAVAGTVAGTLRALRADTSAVLGSIAVSLTTEWRRTSALIFAPASGVNVIFEIEISANQGACWITATQAEWGWLSTYQPQRAALINRDDPEYHIDNTGNAYYDPRGGKWEVTVVQPYDNLTRDQFVFTSNSLGGGGVPFLDRNYFQIQDHNDAFRCEAAHYDSAGDVVSRQDAIPNIDRNAEVTYGYEWDSRMRVAGRGLFAVAFQNGTVSADGATPAESAWTAGTTMDKLYLGCRHTNTAHLEGGVESLKLWKAVL